MKRKVEVEESVCDFCNSAENNAYYHCFACKRDCCSKCEKKNLVSLKESYYHSGEGNVCAQCYAEGSLGNFSRFSEVAMRLFQKLVELKSLVSEIELFWEPRKKMVDVLGREISDLKENLK